MSGFSKVILIGNLTRSPELRYTPGGTAVANFGVAVNRRFKQDGDLKEEVMFIDCVAWSKSAEAIGQYLEKGRQVLIEGRLQQQQWEQDGQRRSKHVIVVEGWQFVGPKKEGGAQGSTSPYTDEPY